MNIGRLRQSHTAFASAFGSLVMGLVNTWPSYTSEQLLSKNTTLISAPMTKGEEALLGSLPSLGAMVGSVITGIIISTLGRRNGGVVLSIPVLISWAVISATSSIKLILAARFFAGISGGASLVMAPIFTSEVAEDSIRGTLASASMFLYTGGTLISYILGWCMTYKTIIWANLMFSTAAIVLLILVTESPVYLLRKKDEEGTKNAIAKYRGVPVSSMLVLDEFTKLKQQVSPSIELVAISVLQPASRKALVVVVAVISMQVFMGSVPVQVYAKTVFEQADPSKADIYTIMFAIVLFGGTAVTGVITDKAGRRILLIMSSVTVCICMMTLGYLLQSKVAPPLVTVVMIFVYSFFFMFGAGTIPYVLLAECFVPEVQNIASMIIIELVWCWNFVIIAIFPYMNDFFGIYGSFYTFATVAFCNATFAYFFVPETKGLSNSQIQDLFLTRRKK